MVLKSFYDAYYFFLLQMEKECYLMKTELKKEAIIERWTDSLQIVDTIFGLGKVTKKLVATIKFYHTLIWYQHSIL